MIIKTLVVALVMAAAFLPCNGENPQNNSERAIHQVESELEAALLKGDSAALDRILAEDYLEIDAQGVVRTKADIIAFARARSAAPRAVMLGPEKAVDELTTRLHGDSALVAGRTTIRNQFVDYQTSSPQSNSQNPVIVDQERFLRVYSKIGGRWKLVAWQTTFIPKR